MFRVSVLHSFRLIRGCNICLQLKLDGYSNDVTLTSSSFFGPSLKKVSSVISSQKSLSGHFKVSAQVEYYEEKQISKDRWAELAL